MFYPAGTLYALAEESYRLGLYGLCNTEHMLHLYENGTAARGASFMPAVDRERVPRRRARVERTPTSS